MFRGFRYLLMLLVWREIAFTIIFNYVVSATGFSVKYRFFVCYKYHVFFENMFSYCFSKKYYDLSCYLFVSECLLSH